MAIGMTIVIVAKRTKGVATCLPVVARAVGLVLVALPVVKTVPTKMHHLTVTLLV